uniref:Uncharacterized protein n=2 Tax=Octactis speculum TaxID=3111310 RepID=A0A7S2C8K0_9STRA|mmetsp:Transcript_33052/g.44764  ORF Transcript_33052/g.44764 Transcript_33052/m.44764 type:complete len:128 (+) Transcript_33052:645-1028(+)
MQIRRFSGYWSKKSGSLSAMAQRQAVPNPGVYGMGMLIGGVAAVFGVEKGCKRAELLAIYDDDKQHKVLVRFYQRIGFKSVRDVGDTFASLGDRLVWGGVGQLMETDLEAWVRKWAPIIRDPGCGLL